MQFTRRSAISLNDSEGNVFHFCSFCITLELYYKIFKFVHISGRRHRVVVIETRLRAGWFAVRMPVEARDSSVLKNVQDGSASCLAPYLMGTGVPSLW
jgi:hypothetical protein